MHSYMRKSISSLALFLALTANASAADYTVQVGAYRSLNDQTIEQAKLHGDVFQRTGSDNLERLSIGRFTNRVDADNLRDRLQTSGFTGAFITTLDSNSSSANYSSTASADNYSSTTSYKPDQDTAQIATKNSNSSYTVDQLNEDERLKATYLDGQLRILSDGKFYTVEQYRQYNGY